MKLYRVEVVKVVYVVAESDADAELDAAGYADEEDEASVDVQEVKAIGEVDSEWRDALPYGLKEDVTVRQWLEKPEDPKPFVDPPEQGKFGFAK